MADLSLLQQDARTAARLTDALQTAHDVAVCSSWSALERRLRRAEVDVCVVDADHPTRAEALERLAALQRRHPRTALVAFGDFRGQGHALYRLGQLGIDGVVPTQRGTDPAHVRKAVDRALLASRARHSSALLDGRVSEMGALAVAWSVEHARARPTVDDLAQALGKTPGSLATLLRKDGLPPPSRVLVWGRLLLAGALLARDGRTVEEVAYRVGYAGASTLARAMKREVGRTPGEIAGGEGMPEVHRALFPPSRTGRNRLRLVPLFLLWLTATGCAASPRPPSPATVPLEARVAQVLDTPPLDGVHVGVLAVEARSGDTVLARNAHRRFIPASNQKLLTTAAALELLGPAHRWRTALWSDAPLVQGELRGELVLVGQGDPTLSARWWPSPEAALEALADSLRAAGVERVTGDLVVDVSAWDSVSVPESWEVGDLPFPWAATGGAFAVGEGELTAVVRGGTRPGDPAGLVSWVPVGTPGFLRHELVTAPTDSSTRARGHYLPETGAVVLRGRVRARGVDTLRLAVREPVAQAAALLRRTLERRGVGMAGDTRIRRRRNASATWDAGGGCAGPLPTCPGARALATLTSPTLAEVAAAVLGPSQNWIAEQLLGTLGEAIGPGGGRAGGLEAVRRWITGPVGLDSLSVVPQDGSGLSVRNLATPGALVAVLERARRAPWSHAWRGALAAPGEAGTTLEDRLLELEGRLVAKTGTISNVDALSGYLLRDDGTELIFSVLSNGSGLPAATVREAVDQVVRALGQG